LSPIPLLFVLAIDPFLRKIEALLGDHENGPRQVAFADDVTCFLSDSPNELETLNSIISEFESDATCYINKEKMVVLSTLSPLVNLPWTQL
jgi:Reverse transcriptase (RNA-dependent DNA polymerase)